MLEPAETQKLITIISNTQKTFEECLKWFQKLFNKSKYFCAGYMLCYFLEEDMLNKTQRVIAIFLLNEMYKNVKILTTPFYPILLKNILQQRTKPNSRAEIQILSEYIVSVPRFQKRKIEDWIVQIEESEEEIEVPDAENYC